ncbi:EAL domain-containing protein [Methylobacillus flagellatus]|uniref:bifunctional diguanylate cyclase/phosphodiesterase n=1 Tax=Methylobacillus flagellatus TaxID=405 RepID=UPI00285414C9|nr:EAL domain-containing protein [Methylobacillus flagellatus]MDR5170568.1 EAL domain-containing protein [Methylobacillus flagellatus]
MFSDQGGQFSIASGGWRFYSPLIVAVLIGISLLGVASYIHTVDRQAKIKEERHYVTTLAAGVRARIEGELNSSIHLGLGLTTYVAANPNFNADSFNRVVASLVHYGRHLKTITMAPGNVVRYVYPLAGNEKLLGLRYQAQATGQEASLEESRHPELVGPIDLVQGGRGLVHRLPLFVFDQAGKESYWGAASVALDIDSLLQAAGLQVHGAVLSYALRRMDDRGHAEMISGDSALFSHAPVLLDITLDGHVYWQLASMPTKGWGQLAQPDDWIFWIGVSLALALATLAYVWLRTIQQLRQRDARTRLATSVFTSSSEGMLIASPGDEVIGINPAVTELTGYSAQELLGMPVSFLAAEQMMAENRQQAYFSVNEKGIWQGETLMRHKQGHVFPVALTITTVTGQDGRAECYINTFSDISERKANEARIHDLAHTDTLTGLPNRMSLYNGLEERLANAQPIGVMILDLDNFKIINDTLGHHVGDQLLVEVARRLVSCVADQGLVARLGGDEFVIVLGSQQAPQMVGRVAEQVLQRLAQPYLIEGYELHSSSSIGIGISPRDGRDAHSLLKNVDTAMYEAKSSGKNNFKFFTEKMREEINERMHMENHLRQALLRDEFELHYQPQVEIATGRIIGMEALVRWNHPEWGMVYPNKFIRIAEECNLVIPLGEWVLREACRQISQWSQQGLEEVCISVNISARQLKSRHLFTLIDSLISAHNIKPGMLELEITESAAMDDPEQTIPRMKKLKNKGVALAIDDFGTGYSSLSYLKLLPLTRLKIDRSFVKDIETDPNDAAICAATIALARILGLGLVAEGVETEAQLDYLRAQGCDSAQGYYFSKPLPANNIMEFVSRHQQEVLSS